MRFSAVPVLCCAAVALSGCGDKLTGLPDIATTTFAPALGVNLATMTLTSSGLYYKDLAVGAGLLLSAGQQVSIHYAGNLANGTQFDANGPAATPFKFTLGAGQVIQGFDQGVAGMHVGGKRQLVIPPGLGYGAQANGPIPANSILVFTIDVVSAQ